MKKLKSRCRLYQYYKDDLLFQFGFLPSFQTAWVPRVHLQME